MICVGIIYKDLWIIFLRVVFNQNLILVCFSKQTEVVLDMTRYITNQVLEQRGMIGARIPNLHTLSKNSDAGRFISLIVRIIFNRKHITFFNQITMSSDLTMLIYNWC